MSNNRTTDSESSEPAYGGPRERVVVVRQSLEESNSVELSEILRVVSAGKWWIAGFAVLFAALAVLHVAAATRIYRAETLLTIASDSTGTLQSNAGGALGTLASLAGLDLGGAGDRRAEYIALLTSRTLLREFITARNLLPALFPDRWDGGRGKWLEAQPTVDQAVERMRRSVVAVADDRRTGLITVRVDFSDPDTSAEWANDLVAFLNKRVREATISEARDSIDFLNREMENTNAVAVRQAGFRLIEANLNRIMLANVQPQYAFRVLDPAVSPDPGRFVRPQPLLEVAVALMFGCMAGFAVAWWRNRERRTER